MAPALKEAVDKPKFEELGMGKALRESGLDRLFPEKLWPQVLAVQVPHAH